jgi:excisionase family DNA binding protein
MKLLLRIPEVCESLGLSRSKVEALIDTGELPIVRVGKSVRIVAKDLSLWVDKLKEKS